MTRRLVAAGVQVKRNHVSTAVIRGLDVSTTVVVRGIRVEELSREVAVERNTVSLNAESLSNRRADVIDDLARASTRTSSSSEDSGSGASRHGPGSDEVSNRTHRSTSGDELEAIETEPLVENGDSGSNTAGSASNGRNALEALTSSAGSRKDRAKTSIGESSGISGKRSVVVDTASTNATAVDTRVLIPGSEHLSGAVINVLSRAQTAVDGLNGPLELVEEKVINSLRGADGLATVDADEREADALNEDIVDLGIHEDVVNEELASNDVGNRDGLSAGSVLSGIVGMQMLEELISTGEGDVNETLTVGDRNGGDGEATVAIKPEEKGDPEIKLRLSGLGGLGTIVDILTKADTGTTTTASVGGKNVGETLVGNLLTNITVPTNALVGGNEEVIVEVENVRIVLIKRVTVDGELNLLAETLTDIVNISKKLITIGGVSSGVVPISSIGSIYSTKLDVENHIIEEVTKLWNRKLYLRIEASGAGLDGNLVIFITNRSEWFAFVPNLF